MPLARDPTLRVTLLPRDTNAGGTIFWGITLSHIDLAGGIAASQSATRNFVTKAMREVEFIAPVYVGDEVSPDPKKQSRHLRFWTPYDRSYRHMIFSLQLY